MIVKVKNTEIAQIQSVGHESPPHSFQISFLCESEDSLHSSPVVFSHSLSLLFSVIENSEFVCRPLSPTVRSTLFHSCQQSEKTEVLECFFLGS